MRWYEEYGERRYLRGASDEAVIERARELLGNLLTLDRNGKISCVPATSERGFFLWRLFSHFLEESRLRTGDYQGLLIKSGVGNALVPNPTAPEKPASPAVLELIGHPMESKRIYKFGERVWMQQLLDRGFIRIAPATIYNDSSLCAAIADDELSYDIESAIVGVDLYKVDPFKARLSDVYGEAKPYSQKLSAATNYYVWCASLGANLRLFEDFNADCVFVIKDVGEFSRRLLAALRECLEGWRFSPCVVSYFDPYHPPEVARSVFSCKHFKYMYQNEIRYVFIPPEPLKVLEPIFLTLGPLHDIAELIGRTDR